MLQNLLSAAVVICAFKGYNFIKVFGVSTMSIQIQVIKLIELTFPGESYIHLEVSNGQPPLSS